MATGIFTRGDQDRDIQRASTSRRKDLLSRSTLVSNFPPSGSQERKLALAEALNLCMRTGQPWTDEHPTPAHSWLRAGLAHGYGAAHPELPTVWWPEGICRVCLSSVPTPASLALFCLPRATHLLPTESAQSLMRSGVSSRSATAGLHTRCWRGAELSSLTHLTSSLSGFFLHIGLSSQGRCRGGWAGPAPKADSG